MISTTVWFKVSLSHQWCQIAIVCTTHYAPCHVAAPCRHAEAALVLLAGGEPPALAAVRTSSRVLALAWLSPEEQQLDLQGRSLLAVLHEFKGLSWKPGCWPSGLGIVHNCVLGSVV